MPSADRRKIPEATVARLPLYLRSLHEEQHAGGGTISSERLAELIVSSNPESETARAGGLTSLKLQAI